MRLNIGTEKFLLFNQFRKCASVMFDFIRRFFDGFSVPADWQDVTTLLRLPSWSMSILTLAKTAVRLKTKNMPAEAVAQRLSLVYESTKRLLAI